MCVAAPDNERTLEDAEVAYNIDVIQSFID
jgi:hypothetical protein